ncbi:MAG: histidine kinase [Chitinophagales bacterium]|jgi:sensor histidine kinase YesM|nr:histidine kinase [Chitinophagales bacterium]
MKLLRRFFIFCIFGFINDSEAAVLENIYNVENTGSKTTIIDSILTNAFSYIGKIEEDFFIIEKPFDDKSYRLNKQIFTPINFCNNSDSIIYLKFYSTRYRFLDAGEISLIAGNRIQTQNSNFISFNKQFIAFKILPNTVLKTYFIQKPIAFKDYYSNKNFFYRYENIFSMPIYDANTSKETVGFCILILLLLGMVAILFIFYGLAFLNLNDKIYLSYTVYLFFTFFQVLYMSQYTFAKCFLLFNYWGNSCFDECTKGFMVIAYCVFYRQAFNLTHKDRIAFFSLFVLLIVSIIYVAIMSISYLFGLEFYFEPTYFILYRLPLFVFSLIFILSSIFLKNKSTFQNLILFGSLIYTLFTIFSTLQDFDWPIKDMLVSLHGLYLGVAFELIVFSVALAMRIRDTYRQSELLKDVYIKELRKNEEFIKNENIILDNRVKERISEIEQKNIVIEEQKKQALIQLFEKEKVEIQMQALTAQMNPHFIFNCMNSIQNAIITNNPQKASTMLQDFAAVIRMVLENSTKAEISLEKEIQLLNTYLKLEQARTNFCFDYQINIDQTVSTDFVNIPTMMLQPIIENSIWHGFKLIEYKGKIEINFGVTESKLICTITDNGIGRMQSKKLQKSTLYNKESMAIKIIQNRIDLMNRSLDENKATINIIDLLDEFENPIGTKVIIELPIF